MAHLFARFLPFSFFLVPLLIIVQVRSESVTEDLFNNSLDDAEEDLAADDLESGAQAWARNQQSAASTGGVESNIFVRRAGGSSFEGDIAPQSSGNLSQLRQADATRLRQHAATTDATAAWPNATIPYKISSRFTKKSRTIVAEAVMELQERTCVQFVPRTDEHDYIYFSTSSPYCSSDVGRVGGKQEVTLGSRECFTQAGVIVHELMHVLGFFHEQARFDRDQYVVIHWANIDPTMDGNFLRYDDYQATVLGTPYDYDSIMHYPSNAFSKNGEPTIEARVKGERIGQRHHLSDFDVFEVRGLYQCPGENPKPDFKLRNDQIVSSCAGDPYQVFTEGCCNDSVVYHLGQFVCCEGRLLPPPVMSQGLRVECCGAAPIALPEQCCNGTTAYNSDTFTCCQDALYSRLTHDCCGGQLYAKPIQSDLHLYSGCCGDAGIDLRKEGCCNFTQPYNYATTGCCVDTVFSRETHVCCGWDVKELPPGTEIHYGGCCAGTPYNRRYHYCCGDTQLYATSTHLCCNGTVYSQATTACCHITGIYDGVAFDKTQSGCCADFQPSHAAVFNRSTSACCDNRVVPVHADSLPVDSHLDNIKCCRAVGEFTRGYIGRKQKCCEGVLSRKLVDDWYSCCGTASYADSDETVGCCADIGVLYDSDHLGCCNNSVLYNRTAHNSCCGGQVYSWDESECCDNTPVAIAPGEGSTHCCGAAAYRRDSHSCCGGVIAERASQACCNDLVYDRATQACCQYVVVPMPAHILENELEWHCCGLQVIARHDAVIDCCSEVVYNYSSQVCCRDVVNPRHHLNECCRNRSFSFATEVCCDSQVSSLPRFVRHRQDVVCCGSVPYNRLHRGCCQGHVYRLKTHTCCADTIVSRQNRTYNYLHCCGLQPYDSAVEHCCGGVVHRFPPEIPHYEWECCAQQLFYNDVSGCCGATVFNYSTNLCCSNTVVPRPPLVDEYHDCCGLTPYESNAHVCCGGTTLYERDDRLDCCGEQLYDPNDSACCLGDIVCPLDYDDYYDD